MHKILLIGDSLSMVRPDSGIKLEDTYAYKMQMKLKNSILINASLRANNSANILTDNYCYETLDAFNPDLIIYFLGIVDCMPRLFTKAERLILRIVMSTKVLNIFGRIIINYRSKRRFNLTKKKLVQFVSISKWDENLEKFIHKIDGKIIFVNIPYPGERLRARNYAVEDIVNKYNRCLLEKARKSGADVVDLHGLTRNDPSLLLEDGYHISSKAHTILSEKLLESVTRYLSVL